jgi:hypothetical protein
VLRRVLAIDLGLRTGLACFDIDDDTGLDCLQWFRSQHYADVPTLKRAVSGVLYEAAGAHVLSAVVMEGDLRLGDVWRKLAVKRGAHVMRVAPETWRADMLLPSQQRNGESAKHHAHTIARDAIERGVAPRPRTPINDDVAEAIAIGVWWAQHRSR